MRYKSVSIKKFRGIYNLELENLSRINLLIGKNNSGKSSILEALFLLTGQNNPRLVLNVDLFRNLLHNDPNDFKFIFYNLKYQNHPEISSTLEDESTRKLTISILTGPKNIPPPTTNDSGIEQSNTVLENLTINDSLAFNSEIKKYHKPLQKFTSSLKLSSNDNGDLVMSPNLDTKFVVDFNAIYLGPNSRAISDVSKRIENVIIEKKKSRLVEALKSIDGSILDVTIGSGSMIYFDIGIDRFIPANLMGDGIWKFITLVGYMNAVPGGVLLIDEIDNGLHFSALKAAWRLLLENARENNIQIFATTHSNEALKFLVEVLEEEKYKEETTSVRCFSIAKLNDRRTKGYAYDFNSLKFSVEKDIEIRGE